MIEVLSWKLCERIITNPLIPLTILNVFEDPGLDFFDLDDNHIVACGLDNKNLTTLYLKYNTKAYDLSEENISLPSKTFHEPQDRLNEYRHAVIALQCISRLKGTNAGSTVGAHYAAKYWAKHISLIGVIDDRILMELQRIRLQKTTSERQVTAADATLVVQWLEVQNRLPIFCVQLTNLSYINRESQIHTDRLMYYPCGRITFYN